MATLAPSAPIDAGSAVSTLEPPELEPVITISNDTALITYNHPHQLITDVWVRQRGRMAPGGTLGVGGLEPAQRRRASQFYGACSRFPGQSPGEPEREHRE